MLNLAMLTALNRPKELRLHMRAAIRNGVTKQEFVEVFLQALIYCGAPAANDSFRMAAEVWSEVEAEQANAKPE
jgi:4-carboxymuconolactone decarboxylase